MTTEQRKDAFIQRATDLHNGKFDYSQVEYVNQKNKVKIICPTHGEFMQTPDKHVAKNSNGCPRCWEELKLNLCQNRDYSKVKKKECLSKEDFLERANQKFNNKYSYDFTDYQGFTKGKIKIKCPIHGEHNNLPRNHLISHTGCPQCGLKKKDLSKTKSYDWVVLQLQKKHDFYYEYPETNKPHYKNKNSRIEIICPKHGEFIKTAQKHLSGQGCWPCNVERMIYENVLVGGYSEELFKKRPELKNLPATLYYIELNYGKLYKIGISRNPKSRMRAIISKAKKFGEEIAVKELKSLNSTLYKCFKLEQKILKQNAQHRVYTPWSTELFNKNIEPILLCS